MYTVYYNFETKAHTIANDELKNILEENEVVIYTGALKECQKYLEPLEIVYQTIDYKCSIPTEDEGLEMIN